MPNIETGTVEGEFGPGAFGPTIRLVADESGVALMRRLFDELAQRESGGSVRFDNLPGVVIRGIKRLELRVVESQPVKRLVESDDRGFDWSCSPDEWQRTSLYLEPFSKGQTGHQFLTSEVEDDALVEVSFHEEARRERLR